MTNYTLFFILLLWRHRIRKREEARRHSRYRKDYYRRLSPYEKGLRDRRIPRIALQNPSESAWRTLLNAGNDQALITLTGLNFETFDWLLERFRLLYEEYSRPFVDPNGKIVRIRYQGRGRKRLIDAQDCLGLVLAWTRTRGSNMSLQMIFGMTGTPVSMYLRMRGGY